MNACLPMRHRLIVLLILLAAVSTAYSIFADAPEIERMAAEYQKPEEVPGLIRAYAEYQVRPDVTVSKSSVNVTESGTTDTYTIVLNAKPLSDVTVTVDPDNETIVSSSGNPLPRSAGASMTLTFTSVNWATAQTVTVTANDDALDEATPHNSTITHSASSSDSLYNGFTIASVTASITDNDTAGVTVTESSGSTSVTEGGATDTYTIVLNSQPTANVTITVDPDAQSIVSSTDNPLPRSAGASMNLTFTSANWNTPQTVTVSAEDDSTFEYNHTSTIAHSSSSGDAGYNSLGIANVVANITDNDPGVIVLQTGGSTEVSEDGTTDTYTIQLQTSPGADVTITIDPDTQTVVSSSGNPLPRDPGVSINITFNSGNWNTPQTITVTAANDNDDELSPHNSTIAHTSSSGDSNYNGLTISNITAVITDNDYAIQLERLALEYHKQHEIPAAIRLTAEYHRVFGITVSKSSLTLSESGVTDAYTYVLNGKPSASVSITVDPDVEMLLFSTGDSSTAAGDAITLTFTTANWATPQTVTVYAFDDADQESSPHTGTITHSVSSSDSYYNSFSLSNITANITDNDSPGDITLTHSGGSTNVTEGGSTDTYTVVLTKAPAADVYVTIIPDSQTTIDSATKINGAGEPLLLKFTSANWSTTQTITVTAVDDFLVEGNHTSKIYHSAQSDDPEYDGLADKVLTANVTDNEFSGAVTITQSSGSTDVTEGGATDTYTVLLNSDPGATVKVYVFVNVNNQTTVSSGGNTGDFDTPLELTFTTANWNTAQTVTVTAVNDTTPEGPHTSVITHSVGSNVTVNITDNDHGLVIVETDDSTDVIEGELTDTYTIKLATAPSANVTVVVNPDNEVFVSTGNPPGDPTGSPGDPISLTFTTGNWSTAQTIKVTPFADNEEEGYHVSTIIHTASSSDSNYNTLAAVSLLVNILDDNALILLPDVGPDSGGTTVLITGYGFSTASPTVTFGGVSAQSIKILSDTQILAVTPAGTGTVEVVVNGNTGVVGSFTYISDPGTAILDNAQNIGTDDLSFANHMASGDFDGDGLVDLAIPLYNVEEVLILRNTTDTHELAFDPSLHDRIALNGVTNDYPFSIAVADFNNDGKSDLAVATWQNSKAIVFLNTTHGSNAADITFAKDAEVSTGDYPRNIIAGDFNGDGWADLITADWGYNAVNDKLSVIKNTTTQAGGSVSLSRSELTVEAGPYGIVAGHFNNDTKLDVAYTTAWGPVGVLKNTSSGGSITFDTTVEIDPNYNQKWDMVAADFNNDGKEDVAITEKYNDGFKVFLNNNSGSGVAFASPRVFVKTPMQGSQFPYTFRPRNLVAADFNSDGRLDIATMNTYTGNVTVYHNTTTGTANNQLDFDEIKTITSTQMSQPLGRVAADLDNDGKVDLAVLDAFTNNVIVFINEVPIIDGYLLPNCGTTAGGTEVLIIGAGFTGATSVRFGNTSLANGKFVVLGDTMIRAYSPAGSGIVDVTVDGEFVDRFDYKSNPGVVSFAAKESFAVASGTVSWIQYGDFNRDAFIDLVSVNYTNKVSVNVNTSTPQNPIDFALQPSGGITLAGANNTYCEVFGEFDNDGWMDIAVSDYSGSGIRILENLQVASIAFDGSYPKITTGSNPYDVTVADFNLDGLMDVVSANFNSSVPYSILKNTSAGTVSFESVSGLSYTQFNQAVAVVVADFNSDSLADLAFCDWLSYPCTVLVNSSQNNNFQFNAAVNPTGASYTSRNHAIAAADFDLDGDMDIVTGDDDNGGVAHLQFFVNNGIATSFVYSSSISLTGHPKRIWDLAVGDFNADGKPDLAVTATGGSSTSDGEVVVFMNNSSGSISFAEAVTLTTNGSVWSVQFGDFDLDGKTDIVASDFTNNLLHVWKNTSSEYKAIITQTGGSTVVAEEGETTDTYTVQLNTQPTANVTITVDPDTQTIVYDTNNPLPRSAGASLNLTFTTANWNTPQTVTVKAYNDTTPEASPHTSTVVHTSSSSDANYNSISIPSVAVNVTDNDTVKVLITETGGSTDVKEQGETGDTYTVVLGSAPTNTVTVSVDPDTKTFLDEDGSGGNPAKNPGESINLTFTTGNWSTPQTVYIYADDDATAEDTPHISTVVHTSSSSDSNYNNLSIPSVYVNIEDNDTPRVAIAETGGGTAVNEQGETQDTYTVVLGSQPSANVTITVDPDVDLFLDEDGPGGAAAKNPGETVTLTFTSGNWNTPQTVYVYGEDDSDDELSPHTGAITHSASSTDGGYNGISIAGVTVSIEDNDEKVALTRLAVEYQDCHELSALVRAAAEYHVPFGVNLSETSVDVTEGGATDTYEIVLKGKPSATVTITITPDTQTTVSSASGSGAGTSGDPRVITFTTGNWSTPQVITVTATNDIVQESSPHTSTITHAVSSSDTQYNGTSVANVTANITDND